MSNVTAISPRKTYRKPVLQRLAPVSDLTRSAPANGPTWDGDFSGSAYDS